MPGPGDPETWPPCANHPNDPRTPQREYDELDDEEQIEALADEYSATELARMAHELRLECNLLRARLASADRDAAIAERKAAIR